MKIRTRENNLRNVHATNKDWSVMPAVTSFPPMGLQTKVTSRLSHTETDFSTHTIGHLRRDSDPDVNTAN